MRTLLLISFCAIMQSKGCIYNVGLPEYFHLSVNCKFYKLAGQTSQAEAGKCLMNTRMASWDRKITQTDTR